MGYSEEESIVRVDFFKPSGKWYATENVLFTNTDCLDGFRDSLRSHFGDTKKYDGMLAVCLEPACEFPVPTAKLMVWSDGGILNLEQVIY